MTKARTIHRRNARKRAKARPPARTFPLSFRWIEADLLLRLQAQLRLADLVSRDYDKR